MFIDNPTCCGPTGQPFTFCPAPPAGNEPAAWAALTRREPLLLRLEREVRNARIPLRMPGYYHVWRCYERRLGLTIANTLRDRRAYDLAHERLRIAYQRRAAELARAAR